MAHSLNFYDGENSDYVDIHGDDIRVFVCEESGQILVPISELKDKGFTIYRKNHYNRLLMEDSQFVQEFDLYLLQRAKSYMLKKQLSFKENVIVESIDKVKKRLSGGSTCINDQHSSAPIGTNQFLEDRRIIENGFGEDIKITREVQKEPLQSSTLLRRPHSPKNNSPDFQKPRTSPDQRSDNRRGDRNRPSFENKKRNFFEAEGQKQTNGFDAQRPIGHLNQNHQKREFSNEKCNKIVTLELNKPEHNVIVVNSEKPGIMWVQDEDNADIVCSIREKVSKEVENQKLVSVLEFGKVYLAPHNNEWYRAKLIRFKPLTVLFLDYGNTAEVNIIDLFEISDELASIPAQAIKVVYDENKYTPQEGDKLTIKVKRKVGKCTFSVDVLCKRVEEAMALRQNYTVEPVKIHSNTVTVPTFVDMPNRPKPLCALQNGQKVLIINEVDGKLALRTRECYMKLVQIENTIKDVILQDVEAIEKNQLILCNKDNRLYRGQVVQIKGTMAEIELLDYCQQVTVKVGDIKQISEALCLEPTTYLMSPTIKGFRELTEKGRNYIIKLIDQRRKAIVILEGADFDLELPEGRLSDMLV